MKSKLHFGILILLITFLIRYLENPVAPNQQILVQFSDTEIKANDTAKTIQAITSKLYAVGVEQVQVGQDQNGHLKITYYSTASAKEIQSLLSDSDSFKLAYGFTDEHSDKAPAEETYKLDVSEIHESNNSTDWDFDDVRIVEHNQKSDRFNTIKKNALGYQIHSDLISEWTKVALSTNNDKLFVDNHSYIIPEVRAGPFA